MASWQLVVLNPEMSTHYKDEMADVGYWVKPGLEYRKFIATRRWAGHSNFLVAARFSRNYSASHMPAVFTLSGAIGYVD